MLIFQRLGSEKDCASATQAIHSSTEPQSSTGVADPREMKLLPANAAANSLTCHVREADANLLNLLQQSTRNFARLTDNSNSTATLFLIREDREYSRPRVQLKSRNTAR
jgi:hypothetical protein